MIGRVPLGIWYKPHDAITDLDRHGAPVKLDYSSIVYEKLRVLRSLQGYTHETISHDIVGAVYPGDHQWAKGKGLSAGGGVDPDSNTETFVQ